MIDEAQGAITCRSSTLAILADSGPFCGLLITVLGSGVISTIEKPRVRLCVGHQHTILADSGPFHGLLLTVSGPKVISTTYEPWGAFTCRSSTLTFLADSGPFHALLLTVLGPQSDFHD